MWGVRCRVCPGPKTERVPSELLGPTSRLGIVRPGADPVTPLQSVSFPVGGVEANRWVPPVSTGKARLPQNSLSSCYDARPDLEFYRSLCSVPDLGWWKGRSRSRTSIRTSTLRLHTTGPFLCQSVFETPHTDSQVFRTESVTSDPLPFPGRPALLLFLFRPLRPHVTPSSVLLS